MGSEIVAIVTSYPSLESQAVAADHRVRRHARSDLETTWRLETNGRGDPPLAVPAPAASIRPTSTRRPLALQNICNERCTP
jgi:hypothetical protein